MPGVEQSDIYAERLKGLLLPPMFSSDGEYFFTKEKI
jgi:hypothetical protein